MVQPGFAGAGEMTKRTAQSARRKSKGDKRERTRAALIEAATELVLEKGYERTTLEEVARHAGMTTGAIYGNFRNKEELFMALSVTTSGPIVPPMPPNTTFAEKMRILADAVIAATPQRRATAIGTLSFRIYALTHEKMLAQVQRETAEIYKRGTAWMEGLATDDDLPMPADMLIPTLRALAEGFWLQRFLTPDLVPDQVIHAAFAAFAGERTPVRQRKKRPTRPAASA